MNDVVISVPSYFTDAERRALLDAARLEVNIFHKTTEIVSYIFVVKAIKCFFSLIKLSIMHCNKHVFVQAFLKSRNKLKIEGGFILFAYYLTSG